jgi:hypothetical protein
MVAPGRVELPSFGLGNLHHLRKTKQIVLFPRQTPAKSCKIRNPGATGRRGSLPRGQATKPSRDTHSLFNEHCPIQLAGEGAYSEWIFFMVNLAVEGLPGSGRFASEDLKCRCSTRTRLEEEGTIVRVRTSASRR